ncbi:aminotransferase class V-fold PLP-dependent enzyme, partial [Mycobacterium kansasii]
PIAELAAECARHGVPMHSDATQATGHVPIDFDASGLAVLTNAAHKFGGPQGVGTMLIGRSVALVPLAHGGGHERDLRSGTPNVAGAAGMAAALTVAIGRMDEEARRRAALR